MVDPIESHEYKKIKQALITLAKCIDVIESNYNYTTREKLIDSILI